MKFNFYALRAIYLHEMDRFRRTLLQSLLSPVLSTSLYFIVFGYIGRHQRKKIGHSKVGLAHGIFLSFAFAATNPIFSI